MKHILYVTPVRSGFPMIMSMLSITGVQEKYTMRFMLATLSTGDKKLNNSEKQFPAPARGLFF